MSGGHPAGPAPVRRRTLFLRRACGARRRTTSVARPGTLTTATTTCSAPTLLRAHVEGDPDAFAVLVAPHRDRRWAVALRTMRNPEGAADALQDGYVSAFRRAGTFRGDAQVTTWLHRVVVNACLDRLRAQRARAADPLPESLDRTPRLGAAPADPFESEQRSDVATALVRLNPDQRAALVRVDMRGYSVKEAAAILGCALGTARSGCACGRARLVPLLAEHRPVPRRER